MQKALFVIIGLGVLALIGWAARDFFTAAEISLWVRIVVGVVAAGVVVLLGIAIRDRMKQGRDEDFKEVQR